MRRYDITLPSPAMCVALLALFVALGGSAYAAKKINGKDIRTGTVGSRVVKDRALTSLDVRRDSLGGATVREERLDANKIDVRRLKMVPSAFDVPQNSIGAGDLGKSIRRFGRSATIANGQLAKADVGCLKGEVVLGGGGRWDASVPGLALQSTYADADTGWTAVGQNVSGAPRKLQAFAVCLAP